MKELDELLFSLNESLASGSLAIQGYDTVKDSFSITKARSSNMQTQGIVFDFSKFEKKYEKALSSNDFDKANSVIQEASGAMDVTSNKFAEASGIRDEMENLYDSLSKLDIPGKTFLDVMRKTDKFFSDGKYEDVVRMSEGNIQDMQHKIEWQKTSSKSIDHAFEALEKGKKAGSKMETSSSFLEQAQVAFDKGDYVNADDLAQESAKESLSSNKAYSEALEHMNDARSEVSSFGDIVAVSALKNMLSNIQENLSNEKFREVKTESKKVIAESGKLKKAMIAISNVRELISAFGNLADVSLLEEGLQELEGMLDKGEFHKVHKRSDILISQCSDLRKSSKPVVEFDFDKNSFVVGQTKKLTINFENNGNASAENFSFEILDDEWVELKKISKNIERLNVGEKEDMIIYIKFKEEGPLIPFPYRIKFQNSITGSDERITKDKEEVAVYGSIDQIGTSSTITSTTSVQAKQKAQYKEWLPNADFTSSEAEALMDYLSKHRESYLKSPDNEDVGQYLRIAEKNKKYNFPLYFEIPQEPGDILNEWGLPEGMRNHVVLNDDREGALKEILESSPEENYVILGEPGIGKTALLFEIFDRFMAEEPTGYLSTDNLNDLHHQKLGIRMFYDDLHENIPLCKAIASSDIKGLVVSARKADWEDLGSEIRDKFKANCIEIKEFDDDKMYDVCRSMLKFSGIRFDEGAIKTLVEDYAEGSPIYVYSMIKELNRIGKKRLQDDYIADNLHNGMHNYISSLLHRLLKKDGEYLPGALHCLACLVFLSSGLKERRCAPIFFLKFGEKISKYTEEKLESPMEKKLFIKIQQYMSGESHTVRFPHDTWADVIEGEGKNNHFVADLTNIKLEFKEYNVFREVKEKAAEESWLIVSDMLEESHSNINIYLSVAETLIHNFDYSVLVKFEWLDMEKLRETISRYENKTVAKNLINILTARVRSEPGVINNYISDSIINRSRIGGNSSSLGKNEISNSVLNRSK